MSEGLDPLVFRTWLVTYSYHTVGLAGDSCACPLACWLSEMFGQPYVVCGGMYGPLDGADVPLPGWAKRFAELVDRTYGYRRVLRIGSLSLLDRCLRGVT